MVVERTTTNKKTCAPIFSVVGPQELWFPLWTYDVPQTDHIGALFLFSSVRFYFPLYLGDATLKTLWRKRQAFQRWLLFDLQAFDWDLFFHFWFSHTQHFCVRKFLSNPYYWLSSSIDVGRKNSIRKVLPWLGELMTRISAPWDSMTPWTRLRPRPIPFVLLLLSPR